jgi:hypothetical protein
MCRAESPRRFPCKTHVGCIEPAGLTVCPYAAEDEAPEGIDGLKPQVLGPINLHVPKFTKFR